jgi:hypothetical protein
MKGEKRVVAAMLVARIGECRGALWNLGEVKVVFAFVRIVREKRERVLRLCFLIWR